MEEEHDARRGEDDSRSDEERRKEQRRCSSPRWKEGRKRRERNRSVIKRPYIAFHFGKLLIGDAEMESKDEKPRTDPTVAGKKVGMRTMPSAMLRYRDGERDDER